ncbi:hypothetical protein DVH05_016309 [Phytophthora capsici]|nr:hypothetical protein DVH05_016309 [Phytophthora capsici]
MGGPCKVDRFDNWMVAREDTNEELVVHCSFLTSYHCPRSRLATIAVNILEELAQDEEVDGATNDCGVTTGTEDRNEDATASTMPARGPRMSADDTLTDDRDLPLGPEAETRMPTEVTATDKRTVLFTGTAVPRISRGSTAQGAMPTGNSLTQASDGGEQQTTDQSRTEARNSAAEATLEETRRPDERTRKQKAREITRGTVGGDRPTSGDVKRQRETDARAERAARRNTLRDQPKTTTTEKVDTGTDRGVSGTATTRTYGTEREGDGNSRTTRPEGGDSTHRTTETSRSGQPDDDTRDVGGPARALRGHGHSRWPSAAKTILAEATTGTVREQGQRKVRNKAGRYETEYRVEYQERAGAPIIRAWITAREFEQLLDEGKIGDDLLAGDGVWTR